MRGSEGIKDGPTGAPGAWGFRVPAWSWWAGLRGALAAGVGGRLGFVVVFDLICFRNERVDLTVDGQRLERPVTPWS